MQVSPKKSPKKSPLKKKKIKKGSTLLPPGVHRSISGAFLEPLQPPGIKRSISAFAQPNKIKDV